MVESQIIHGDALQAMRALPDSCAGLIIADPPYNLDKDKQFGIRVPFSTDAEWVEWSRSWLGEAKRLLTPKGNLFVYAIHHNACYLQCALYALGLEYRRQIIWYYENGWSKYTLGPACHYEPILWFSRHKGSTYHVIREPYKSTVRLKHRITKGGKEWKPHPDGRQAGDVWRFPTLAGRRFAKERTKHPTQKPERLTARIVKYFSNPGELVLVPFVGSGTECVVAAQLGRRFWGAELNAKYVEIARSRLARISPEFLEVRTQQFVGPRTTSEAMPLFPDADDA